MDCEFTNKSAYTVGKVILNAQESITVESGSMLSYTEGVEMETKASGESGGLLSSIKDSVLSGEELFRNVFTATQNDEEVRFAHTQPGDMEVIMLEDESVFIQSGSYLANTSDVVTSSTSGGLDSMFGGKGLFFLEAGGSGALFVGGYGGIITEELEEGEKLTVDAGHSVAWEESVEFTTHRVGGVKKTLLSGEGFVMTFTGPGKIYLQTRDYDTFISNIATQISD